MVISWLKNSNLIQKIKGIGVFLIPVALYLIPLNWLKNQHTICIFKNFTGHDCYGCGMTRSILSALHFKFTEAYGYNNLIIIVLPLLLYVWLKLLIKLWEKPQPPAGADLQSVPNRNKS